MMNTTQTSEFQGILTLNKQLVEQLERFLNERETKACRAILQLMEVQLTEPGDPPFLPAAYTSHHFSELVDLVGKRVRQLIQTPTTGPSNWRYTADKMNEILWDYLEKLEGSVTELFQQLDQVGVEDWSIDLKHMVDAIKEILLHRLDDL